MSPVVLEELVSICGVENGGVQRTRCGLVDRLGCRLCGVGSQAATAKLLDYALRQTDGVVFGEDYTTS